MKTTCKIAAIVLTIVVGQAKGALIELGGLPDFREAWLSSAEVGFVGTGNATVTEVNAYLLPLAPWAEVGSVAPPDNSGTGTYSDGLLSVNLTSGDWGQSPAEGAWTIASAFWDEYDDAAISLHVGNARGVDEWDHFVWRITPETLTGVWGYDGGDIRGGGLSNIKLYGSKVPNTQRIPDSGATLALLGIGIMGMGLVRRHLR